MSIKFPWNQTSPKKGELSKLLLDDTFDPSSQEAQKYLLNFCDRLFATDFASVPNSEYQCAVNQFDFWLKEQAANMFAKDPSIRRNAKEWSAIKESPSLVLECLEAVTSDRGYEYDIAGLRESCEKYNLEVDGSRQVLTERLRKKKKLAQKRKTNETNKRNEVNDGEVRIS